MMPVGGRGVRREREGGEDRQRVSWMYVRVVLLDQQIPGAEGESKVERLTAGPFLLSIRVFYFASFQASSFRFEMHLLTLKRSGKDKFSHE